MHLSLLSNLYWFSYLVNFAGFVLSAANLVIESVFRSVRQGRQPQQGKATSRSYRKIQLSRRSFELWLLAGWKKIDWGALLYHIGGTANMCYGYSNTSCFIAKFLLKDYWDDRVASRWNWYQMSQTFFAFTFYIQQPHPFVLLTGRFLNKQPYSSLPINDWKINPHSHKTAESSSWLVLCCIFYGRTRPWKQRDKQWLTPSFAVPVYMPRLYAINGIPCS